MGWFKSDEEEKAERLQEIHNKGQVDGSKSEMSIHGLFWDENHHKPHTIAITERAEEENETYEQGFVNGLKNNKK